MSLRAESGIGSGQFQMCGPPRWSHAPWSRMPSPEEMQKTFQKWMDWIAALLNDRAPIASGKWSQPFLLRAINANFRVGDGRSAKALAQFAANKSADTAMRVEALEQLSHWGAPPARDAAHRPVPEAVAHADHVGMNAAGDAGLGLRRAVLVLHVDDIAVADAQRRGA